MGLLPLEFTDCLTDSPYFRENLHAHEHELDSTNSQIKDMIKDVKELLSAAKTLSKAQRQMANTLSNFTFNSIGGSQTDDEIVIAGSLKEFGRLLHSIEDERDRMLERAEATFIEPIERFRGMQIGGAKEGRKKFEKETNRFCQSLERHLNLSTKKSENHLQEADASLEMEQRYFVQASLEYVLKLQEVHERKKFEFVETILSFMYGWLTFYHQGHEAACEFKTFMTDLQVKLQKTRENYNATHNEASNLMQKMLQAGKMKPQDPGALNKMYTRQGYLFLMEKKAFGTQWIKQFCQYQKENRKFTMLPYNQTISRITTTDTITLKECIRRMSDSIDKRFCFDIIPVEKPSVVYTFQALSEEDRKLWLDAMDGKDPLPSSSNSTNVRAEEFVLDEFGFAFVRKCIDVIESRGLDDQGLYRVGGVASKVTKLVHTALECRKKDEAGELSLEFELNCDDWEIRTITSALKHFFRNLPEPLMTYRFHTAFIAAAKQENRAQRMDLIHCLVHKLPKPNFELLHILVNHLIKVSSNQDKNLMTISNLGVCFGPTLLRPEEETVAAIMDIKFGNVVVEILIENCDKIFNTKPMELLSKASQAARLAQQPPLTAPYPHPANSQITNHAVPIYGRGGAPDHHNYNYATIPSRAPSAGNHVYRSSSHDHLVGVQQMPVQAQAQFQPRTRPVYHQATFYQPSPNATPLYTTHNSGMPPQHPPYIQSNGPQMRPYRPQTPYNPWNSQPNIVQQPQAVAVGETANKNRSSPGNVEQVPSPQNYQQISPSSSPSTSQQYYQQQQQNYGVARQQSQSSFTSTNSTPPSLASTDMSTVSSSPQGRRVRTMYACIGENPSELSFEPNVIIVNVRPSKEPGWLEGFYKGKMGLIPENYVQFVD